MGYDRYTTPEMRNVWSERSKIRTWARIEVAAAIAQDAPDHVIRELNDSSSWPTVEACDTEEAETRHDVVAFVQAWRSNLQPEAASWVHRNMTSSDLVDSAIGIRLTKAACLIDMALSDLTGVLARHALKHQNTVRVARTHGQHAELSTWGYRVAGFAHSVRRSRQRLLNQRDRFARGKLSGPVGDYKRIPHAAEVRFLRALGINGVEAATQVVPRDGLADFVWACAQITSVLEEMAMEIRLCARTDTGEVSEGFKPGQRGSSAMPHKRNPITAERLCGIARLVRAQVGPVLEGAAVHHERDLAHSSVERVALPMVSALTEFAVREACDLWYNLVVHEDRMKHHASQASNVALSAQTKDHLIASGVNPDVAWRLVAKGSENPSGCVVEETRLEMRRVLGAEAAEGVDWAPLLKVWSARLTDRVGNTAHVFDGLELMVD